MITDQDCADIELINYFEEYRNVRGEDDDTLADFARSLRMPGVQSFQTPAVDFDQQSLPLNLANRKLNSPVKNFGF